jgi:hypothetical protein
MAGRTGPQAPRPVLPSIHLEISMKLRERIRLCDEGWEQPPWWISLILCFRKRLP